MMVSLIAAKALKFVMIISEIRQGIAFVKNNGLNRAWVVTISPQNRHPVVQITKYGICGVVATLVHQVVFALSGYTIFPHFEEISQVMGLNINQRIINFSLSSLAGFMVSDVVCYLMNAKFVFESGRHHGVIEFLLFTFFASIGFFAGLGMAVAALKTGTSGSWGANFGLIAISILVNYLCRRFFVFKA